MNIYNVFTTVFIVLIHLLRTNDHHALAPLLDAPEYDTTYSICYVVTPPAVPFTIDPSPPVLAPPYDPDHAPTLPHTFVGATSAGHGTNSRSVNWTVNLLAIIISGLLVHVSASPRDHPPLTDCTLGIRRRSLGSFFPPVSQLTTSAQRIASLTILSGAGSSNKASPTIQGRRPSSSTLPAPPSPPYSPLSPFWSSVNGS